jgi:hypothetical protein
MRIQILPLLVFVTAQASGVDAQALRGLSATATVQTINNTSICGANIPEPASLPPPSMKTVLYLIAPCLNGRSSGLDPKAYVADIYLKPSRSSRGEWVQYDASSEETIMEDFQRLWRNHNLAALSVDIRDYRFSNGVIGKLVIYIMTEPN